MKNDDDSRHFVPKADSENPPGPDDSSKDNSKKDAVKGKTKEKKNAKEGKAKAKAKAKSKSEAKKSPSKKTQKPKPSKKPETKGETEYGKAKKPSQRRILVGVIPLCTNIYFMFNCSQFPHLLNAFCAFKHLIDVAEVPP